MVERFNRTLEAQLAKFVSEHQRDWDRHLQLLMMAYRTSVHDTTGETPAMMMMGRNLRLPVDLFIGRPEEEQPEHKSEYARTLLDRLEKVHNYARQHLKMKSDKMKSHYDLQATGDELKEGDPVWLYNPQRKKGVTPKLNRPWQGPYIVTKKITLCIASSLAGDKNQRWCIEIDPGPIVEGSHLHGTLASRVRQKQSPESNLL